MNIPVREKDSHYLKYPDSQRIRLDGLTSHRDILRLFKDIFDRDFKEDLLEWFARCPTGGNLWYGAFEGDDPVGMYGLLPIKVKMGAQIYQAALCNNVGVIPRYFGKGLFQVLGEYALGHANFPLVVCVPNVQAARGHKIIGWENFGVLELLSADLEEGKEGHVAYNKFQYIPRQHEPYFYVVKDYDFMRWRYSKPNEQYFQSVFDDDHYVIWKNYRGRKQVLEISNPGLVYKLGGKVDILQFQDSRASLQLKNSGFKVALSNEFLLYTDLGVDKSMGHFEFEPADNDVF